MPSGKAKQSRARRLTKIKRAVAIIENRLAVSPTLNDAFRSLYYLERLAKKAK